MPNPISKVNSSATICIADNTDSPSKQRPQLALLAMNVIWEWSILESYLGWLFVTMLGSNPAPGAAIYSSLTSTAAQKSAFRSLASFALMGDEIDIFEAILDLFSTAAKSRNKIAHWVWGYSPQILDGLLLCNPRDVMAYQTAVEQYHSKNQEIVARKLDKGKQAIAREGNKFPRWPMNIVFVFYAKDFENMSKDIQRLTKFVMEFRLTLKKEDSENRDGKRLQRLLSEPEVGALVTRLREDRKNAQEVR